MIEYEFLTPEDFKTAASNGISYIHAYHRFYVYKWSKKKAITFPVKKRGEGIWSEWKEVAEKHGVSQSAFYQRLKRGKSYEEAATEPLNYDPLAPYGKNMRRANAKVNDNVIETAAKNGISEATLKKRVYVYKWDVERASTEPINYSKGSRKNAFVYRRKNYEATRT